MKKALSYVVAGIDDSIHDWHLYIVGNEISSKRSKWNLERKCIYS